VTGRSVSARAADDAADQRASSLDRVRPCSTEPMNIQELLHSMAERVSASASVKNVYGDPVVVGTRTVIPAAQVRYAFGGGGGPSKENPDAPGGGGGGRVSARPCGALEITPEGTRFIAFEAPRRMGAVLALGFVLGAAVVALTGTRRITVVKR
jgi:uncharacterized spore protein YtfJ